MIDFVAKSYEENRFDPDKAHRSVAELVSVAEPVEARHLSGILRRSLSLSKRTEVLRRVAGIAAATIIGIFLYTSWRTSWTSYTAYDIAQTFTLPDSSSVTLAPGATLRLQRHKDNRLVQMTGKIYFNVRHDDRAPFRINAGSGFVKVLGTRFQVDAPITPSPASVAEPVVRRSSPTIEAHHRRGTHGHFGKLSDRGADSISVSVVSGKVLFTSSWSDEDGLILTKGQSAVLRQGTSAPTWLTPKHPNPAAWATGEFIYDNTPLPDVLSELSEYYGVRLSVADPYSTVHYLSGEFSTSSLPEIINLINSALGTDIQIESQPAR